MGVLELEKMVTKDGQTQWKKPPFDTDGRRVDITDPQSSTTFDKAYAAYTTGRCDGIGSR